MMDSAHTTAWNMYVERVTVTLRTQLRDFERGRTVDIMFSPPTPRQVAIVERALHNARLEGRDVAVKAALGPIVRAIDAIDNSRTKKASPAVRELYAVLTDVYDELHRVKTELPQASAAGDPHATSTGKPTTRDAD